MAGELLAVSRRLDQGDIPGVPRGDRRLSRGVLKFKNINKYRTGTEMNKYK